MTLVLSNQDFNGTSRITNLPAPLAPTEPVRLQDLNSAVEGLAWKDSCRVAAPANINIASPGASIDGIALVAGDRVLLLAQTTPAENGIYVWNGAAVAAIRSLDANIADELEGATTTVEEGVTNSQTTWRQSSVDFVLGTGAVLWTSFASSTPISTNATAGSIRTATQAEVDAGVVANAAVTPVTLANLAGRIKKFAATIGDGSATLYAITHNLNNLDVDVEVYRIAGGLSVIVDVARVNFNTVQIAFAAAPASNAFRVVVTG